MVGSNLFAIDRDATLRTASEANAELAARHRRMMAARPRASGSLATGDGVNRARRFLALLADSAKRCRRARLDNT